MEKQRNRYFLSVGNNFGKGTDFDIWIIPFLKYFHLLKKMM